MRSSEENLRMPLLAAGLALSGGLAVTFALHAAADRALAQVLDARLLATGKSTSLFIGPQIPARETLAALERSNDLDAAYVLDRELVIVADEAGGIGRRANLLRIDRARIARALAGESSVAPGYSLDELQIISGYFPLGSERVLVLEAGEAFSAVRASLFSDLVAGVALSLLLAACLGLAALRWKRVERKRAKAEAEAARAASMTRMAAVAAHEIRNPLGIIRATVELMSERAQERLQDRDREALGDVLSEVVRLNALTEDLLELSADRPLDDGEIQIGALLEEAKRSAEAAFGKVELSMQTASELVVRGDARRLRQVLVNLLKNAAEAPGTSRVSVDAAEDRDEVRIFVADDGDGISDEIRDQIFEPYFTTKSSGTGLGLALSRRLIERHGGSLSLKTEGRAGRGTTFEIRLPLGREHGSAVDRR
jgi:signal transduction histidine kinase